MPHSASRAYAVCFSMFLALLLALPIPASSDDKLKAINRVPGPMVLPQAWPGGETMPQGLFAIMNHFSLAYYKPYKHSSPYTALVKTPRGGMKVGPKGADQFVNVFKIRYALTDRFEVRTATPYIDLNIQNNNADDSWKGGLGDTTVMLRYGLKKRTDDSPFSLALDLGATLPTGDSRDRDKNLANNAFSVIMGSGASWVDSNQRVDVDARYAAYTEGAYGVRPGDFALFHAHYAYALTRSFDLGLEAYYRNEQQSCVYGKGQQDAFSEAYAGPKMQFRFSEAPYMSVGAAVLFPMYRDYEDMRLSTDTRYEFSILFAF